MLASGRLLIASFEYIGDIHVSAVGYYGLSVIIQISLRVRYILFYVRKFIRRYLKPLEHLFVTLEYLYGIPSLLIFGHIVQYSFLDMGYGMLDGAREYVSVLYGTVFRRGYRGFGSFLYARPLKGRYLDYVASELP